MVYVLRFDPDTYTCCLVSIFSPETSVAHMWKGLDIYLRLFRGGSLSAGMYFCLFLFLWTPEVQRCVFTMHSAGLEGCQISCPNVCNNIY